MSSINTTPHQGVNVGQTPVKTPHNWSLGDEDNDAADSAPNTGTLAGNSLLKETGPDQYKGLFTRYPNPYCSSKQ